MVPADSDRIPRVPPYSGYHLDLFFYVYRAVTSYGPTFQSVPLQISIRYDGPTTPDLPEQTWFGLFPFRSPLLWKSLLFSFPPGT